MKPEDEVITLIRKEGIPAGTFGIVEEVDGDDIWVDVYIPADDDVPTDTVCYAAEELRKQGS